MTTVGGPQQDGLTGELRGLAEGTAAVLRRGSVPAGEVPAQQQREHILLDGNQRPATSRSQPYHCALQVSCLRISPALASIQDLRCERRFTWPLWARIGITRRFVSWLSLV